MEACLDKIFKYYAETLDWHPAEDGVLDIDVTYDVSWHTRGHTSNMDLGIVIDAHTTLVLDYCILSKCCQQCACMSTNLKKGKLTQESYNTWKGKHTATCCLNYEGSSDAMEEQAAVSMWKRSLPEKLRYLVFVGDRDCSSHRAVTALNNNMGPNGAEKQVHFTYCVVLLQYQERKLISILYAFEHLKQFLQ